MDSPVTGTLAGPIQLFLRTGRTMVVHESETAQMQSHLQYLRMDHGLAEENVIPCVPCVNCAATLCLRGAASTASSQENGRERW